MVRKQEGIIDAECTRLVFCISQVFPGKRPQEVVEGPEPMVGASPVRRRIGEQVGIRGPIKSTRSVVILGDILRAWITVVVYRHPPRRIGHLLQCTDLVLLRRQRSCPDTREIELEGVNICRLKGYCHNSQGPHRESLRRDCNEEGAGADTPQRALCEM